MPRKSSIERLPPVIKAAIAGMLKDNRLTLDEILEQIRAEFPDEPAPSRSALGRFKQNFEEMSKHLRESREIADMWVQKVGSDPNSDIGKLAIEFLRTAAYRVSSDMVEGGEANTKELAQLARAMNYIENASRLSLKREQELTTAAKTAAAEAATKVAEKKGVSAETVEEIRRGILEDRFRA
jgi:hypothetical protein